MSPSLPSDKAKLQPWESIGHIHIWNNSQIQKPSSKISQAFARENSSSLQPLPFWLALTLFWHHQQNAQAVGSGDMWQTYIDTTPRAALKPIAISITTEYIILTPLSKEVFFFPSPLILKLTIGPLGTDSHFPLNNNFMRIGLASPIWRDRILKVFLKNLIPYVLSPPLPEGKRKGWGTGLKMLIFQ